MVLQCYVYKTEFIIFTLFLISTVFGGHYLLCGCVFTCLLVLFVYIFPGRKCSNGMDGAIRIQDLLLMTRVLQASMVIGKWIYYFECCVAVILHLFLECLLLWITLSLSSKDITGWET